MSLHLVYCDGSEESLTLPASEARRRFNRLVSSWSGKYVEPITIELLDNRKMVYQSYSQNY